MTVTEFLLARIAEDEAAAKHASPGPWAVDELGDVETVPEFDLHRFDIVPETIARTELRKEDGQFIARHDPARVLAECTAKRAIIQKCLEWPKSRDGWDKFPLYAAGNDVLFALAAAYKDHPDYEQEWAA